MISGSVHLKDGDRVRSGNKTRTISKYNRMNFLPSLDGQSWEPDGQFPQDVVNPEPKMDVLQPQQQRVEESHVMAVNAELEV